MVEKLTIVAEQKPRTTLILLKNIQRTVLSGSGTVNYLCVSLSHGRVVLCANMTREEMSKYTVKCTVCESLNILDDD